jgi:hypothetical protein
MDLLFTGDKHYEGKTISRKIVCGNCKMQGGNIEMQ